MDKRSAVTPLDATANNGVVLPSIRKKNRIFMPLFFVGTGAPILGHAYWRTGTSGLGSAMGLVVIGFGIINYAINRIWVKEMAKKKIRRQVEAFSSPNQPL